MKAYIATSGTIFFLLVAAHIWRLFVEGPQTARDPSFVAATLIPAALAAWASRLLLRSGARGDRVIP